MDDHELMVKPVRMCACTGHTFAMLKAEGVTSVEEAARRFGVGDECGCCVCYLRQMFETGETEFEVMVL